jgi:flagellar basal body rod protein FlgC
MQITSIALAGLSAAEANFNQVASGMAHSVATAASQPDTLSLSTSAVNLLADKQSYSANLRALQIAGDIAKQAVDLMG